MIRSILFTLFIFVAIVSKAQDKRFCRKYKLYSNAITEQLLTSDTVCYESKVTKRTKRGVLVIQTDKLTVVLAVLNSFTSGSRLLIYGVVPGEPDQLYVVREETTRGVYILSINPIRMNRAHGEIVRGTVLEISNQPICR